MAGVQVVCPKCGNKVEGDKPCPFCAYASSVGIPEEYVTPEAPTSLAGADAGSPGFYDYAILSGFVTNKYLIQKALEDNFSATMFALPQAQKLGGAILEIYQGEGKSEAWDKQLLRAKLKARGSLSAGLEPFFNRVLDVPSPGLEQLISYLALIKSAYAMRVVDEVGTDVAQFTSTSSGATRDQIEKFVATAIEKLHGVQKLSVNKRVGLVRSEIEGILDDIEFREKNGEVDIIGFSLNPLQVINQTLSGLRRGFLYCLAGAPRRGKTNLALDIATYCARENKIPVLFFTYEQTKRNLTYRLLSKESYLNPGTLQRKRILNDPVRKAKLTDGVKRMADYKDNFYIIEATKEDTIERIRGYAYNMMQEHNTNDIVLFIDYIQKMPLSRDYDNERFKVEEISTSLKALSIELNCPIFAISSLNKEGCQIDETEGTERPSFFHCKGSGDIEYDVDVAMVLAKDWGDTKELYEQLKHKAEAIGKDPTRLPKVDIVNLHVDKNRDAPEGILGTVQFFFFIEENKYVELGYKLEGDVYRFKKIESLVAKLIERGFIRFVDYEERGRGGQFEEMIAQQQPQVAGLDDSSAAAAEKRKIRLKY